MVVTGHGQYAAPGRGARHVGVFENVGATVHARAFAIPNAKDTIKAVAARRGKTQLLRAPQRGGGQFFVHAGLKDDVLRLQIRFGFPQKLVVTAQG